MVQGNLAPPSQYLSLAEELLLLAQEDEDRRGDPGPVPCADPLAESRMRILELWPPVMRSARGGFSGYAPAVPPRLSAVRPRSG